MERLRTPRDIGVVDTVERTSGDAMSSPWPIFYVAQPSAEKKRLPILRPLSLSLPRKPIIPIPVLPYCPTIVAAGSVGVLRLLSFPFLLGFPSQFPLLLDQSELEGVAPEQGK